MFLDLGRVTNLAEVTVNGNHLGVLWKPPFAVEVTDAREVDLPDVGLISVVDPETGRRRLVDTSKAKVRKRYGELADQRRRELASVLASCGADHLAPIDGGLLEGPAGGEEPVVGFV